MKLIQLILGASFLAASASANAALVSVNASADMSSGFPLATSLLPVGTTVTSDVSFDIGSGTIDTSIISNVSGTFNWIDGVLGAQEFNAQSASLSTINAAGWFLLRFSGSGPTIGGITPTAFSIQFDIGTNPFTSPGNSSELFDLVLNSTIDKLRVGASQGGSTAFGELETNVSGFISPVPVPGALVLFISGILGLYAAKTVKSSNASSSRRQRPQAAGG